ncbi:hypothetical protein ACHAPT_002174 [Fusarium lateritium]
MDPSNNPDASSSKAYGDRSEADKAAADALLILSQGPAQAPSSALASGSAQASSSAAGNDAPDPNLAESDRDPGDIDADAPDSDEYEAEDEQAEGAQKYENCFKCGKPRATNGKRLCNTCHTKRMKAEGRCRDCGKGLTSDDKARCADCLAKQAEKLRVVRQRAREAKK